MTVVNLIATVNRNSDTQLTIGNDKKKALFDSGAGPSCMTTDCYRGLGLHRQDVDQIEVNLTAANGTALACRGLSKPVEFQIGTKELSLQFLIVDNLGGEDIILGRDFLTMYDVLLDVPRGRMDIRNEELLYTTRTRQVADQSRAPQIAKLCEDTTIQGTQIQTCKFEI